MNQQQQPISSEKNANQSVNDDLALAAALRTNIGRLVKIMRRETRNEEMLSLTERSTLGLLDQYPGSMPTELAAMEKVTTQSMSQVINHLHELGFVLRSPSSQDGRKVLLSLSEAGREYLMKAREEKQEWLAKIIAEKLDEGQKQVLAEAMELLKKLID